MKKVSLLLTLLSTSLLYGSNYSIVDTGQKNYFDDNGYIKKPTVGSSYFGQDSSYLGNQPSFQDNQNGTVTDNVTGLMWQKKVLPKMTYSQAVDYANSANIGGYSDWRIPTIKELYSLVNFKGQTGKGNPNTSKVPYDAKPYIDTKYFDFEYPKERRFIDAQYWSSTDYVNTTMGGAETFFGVNFADGRIKGYPKFRAHGKQSSFYLRVVRGNKNYGKNKFVDNRDGTVYDRATNLMWMKNDSQKGMKWESALAFCESLQIAGKSNWRLPNAKELQSIVDYTRSPDTTNSAAIDKLFHATSIENEENVKDFASYWSSTTHLDGRDIGSFAIYVSFGRALGYMQDPRLGTRQLMDVHGAGAQRSDPKSGSISRYERTGHGPQGDVIRVKNFVRCVSDNFTVLNTSNDYEIKSRSLFKPQKGFEMMRQNKPAQPQRSTNRKGPSSLILERFDKNSDNMISYKEAPTMMQRNFSRHDKNEDGFLDESELSDLPKPQR